MPSTLRLLFAMAVVGCAVRARANQRNVRATEPNSNQIFMLTAESGTLVRRDRLSNNTFSLYSRQPNFELSLEGVSGVVTWFEDRPDRNIGHEPTDKFVENFPFGAVNPPNAALTAAIPTVTEDWTEWPQIVLLFTLAAPQYNAGARTLQYAVTLLDSASQLRYVPDMLGLDSSKVLNSSDVVALLDGEGELPLKLVGLTIDSCPNWCPNCHAIDKDSANANVDINACEFAETQQQPCGELSDSNAVGECIGMCTTSPCSYCEPCYVPEAYQNAAAYANQQMGNNQFSVAACGNGCGTAMGESTNDCYGDMAELCDFYFYSCCNNACDRMTKYGGCTFGDGCQIGCYGE